MTDQERDEARELHREVVRHLVEQIAELTRERDRALACEAAARGLLVEWREAVVKANAISQRFQNAESEVSYLKSVREVTYAEGYAAGVEAAATLVYGWPDADRNLTYMSEAIRALSSPPSPTSAPGMTERILLPRWSGGSAGTQGSLPASGATTDATPPSGEYRPVPRPSWCRPSRVQGCACIIHDCGTGREGTNG